MKNLLGSRKSLYAAFGGLLMLVLGIGIGWALNQNFGLLEFESVREESSEYRFIKPLLFVRTSEEAALPKYAELKLTIDRYADNLRKSGKVQDISIYFRNLDTSQWVGENTEERFAPASMLKVTTLIAILRVIEDNPKLLERNVRLTNYDQSLAIEQKLYPPDNPVKVGETYRVKELLEKLIVESDNVADMMLRRLAGEEEFFRVFDSLELSRPTTEDHLYTSQEYSRIFRTLYNGTYLSRDSSEYALSLLSRTSFKSGIAAGVPRGTQVSHKFGVRTVTDRSGTKFYELHDCGIVYYPKEPYFLCVMTRSHLLSELEDAIVQASAIVWQEIDALHSAN